MTSTLQARPRADRFERLLSDRSGVRLLGVPEVSGASRTRLLDEFAALASARGALVARGRARGGAYGLFQDAFGSVSAHGRERDVVLLLRGLLRAPRALGMTEDELRRAVDAVLGALPGLVLLLDDVHLADRPSLALLEHLVRRGPGSPLLVVLAHEPRSCPPALAALLVAAERESLATVVRLPVDGHRLTQRERTVLVVLAEGLTADAIARRLDISPRTVHRHLQHLYRKLGTTDRLATVLRAQELGLLG
ncbi:helix-turn-helix transcriptional regulator [Actinosynnema pretiosum]|uniref:helix-turn-helix transcriptional regulator n=2 Tax=Actinosynnema TaxID=40566 RepID=UPI0012FE23A1|nr:LuxR C-terminal-related transcriptional regulator [Actinosynnema pretiosum]